MRRQPVAAAMRPAAVTPASEPSASPPRSSTPPGSAAAARSIASSSTRAGATRAGTSARPSASPHAQSAGTMSVATPPGGPSRGGDRVGEVAGQRVGAARRPHPARHRAREALDVRLQRRALAEVRRRVVAHDDHDRRAGLGGVVEVGEAVGQPRPEVQQDERGPAGQAPVGVGGARADALEQPEDRADPGALERLHEVQLGGARVGEADVQSGCRGGPQQGVRPARSICQLVVGGDGRGTAGTRRPARRARTARATASGGPASRTTRRRR